MEPLALGMSPEIVNPMGSLALSSGCLAILLSVPHGVPTKS